MYITTDWCWDPLAPGTVGSSRPVSAAACAAAKGIPCFRGIVVAALMTFNTAASARAMSPGPWRLKGMTFHSDLPTWERRLVFHRWATGPAVTTVTWISHCSHEPDADESRLEQAGPRFLSASSCNLQSCKQAWSTVFALGQHTGSPSCAEPDAGSRIALPSSVTCPTPIWLHMGCAHISARYHCIYIGPTGLRVNI